MPSLFEAWSQLSPLLTAGLILAALLGALLGYWGAKFLLFFLRMAGLLCGAALAGVLFLLICTDWSSPLLQQFQPFLK